MHISSGYLEQEQLKKELAYIIEFLKKHAKSAYYAYGWGSSYLNVNDCWVRFPIEIDQIPEFVLQSIEKKFFNYGDSDLFFYDDKLMFCFKLCHECDVHFESNDLNLMQEVAAIWRKKGYKICELPPATDVK